VKLLEIQSSPRGESSDSITLTKSFIEACKSDNTSIVVDTLNVWHERLPEFDYEAIGAKYKAVKHETMTRRSPTYGSVFNRRSTPFRTPIESS
jgi:FMN-dependent NADH-azoreductase